MSTFGNYNEQGVQITRLRALPGHSYFRMSLEKSERNCLTGYLYNAAIRVSFFIRVLIGVLSCEFAE